ncbi:MAG: hypothetical protein IKZ58_09505 [Selenomonadaceae bacterium]|nr:hypothetical protein [Selenomonadaceae bacterium]
MSEENDKLSKNFQRMIHATKAGDNDNHQRQMANRLMQIMDTTKKVDGDEKQKAIAQQFAAMMQQTRSFDAERDRLEKAGETAISNAFQKMIHLSHKLEEENKLKMEFPPDVGIEKFPSAGDKLFITLINKLPKRIRRFPQAFRRNPKAVIKFFIAMIIGRILAITLYVIAAFIPALPLPDSVTGAVGKAPAFLGNALGSLRGAVTEFSFQAVMATVTSIPTDINKLLQKLGEFLQYYAQRTGKFLWLMIRHPQKAFREICTFCRKHAQLFLRIGKGTIGVIFSFIAIKLTMVFLLPLFGGIAITVLGFKISIIIIVVVRMAISTLSEVVGKLIGGKCISYCKAVYNDPEILWSKVRRNMEEWMKNWNEHQRP